jgi:cellulose synthase/poly-beta-1,6-N-acetylglucosamine synthase-like glycosyltransferase
MKSSMKFQLSSCVTEKGTPIFASTYGPANNWHISILIPARNEEVLLPRCLLSVQRARLKLPPEVTSDVIVVDDASSDRTRALAERILEGDGIVVSATEGVVGSARSLAAKTALDRYKGPAHLHWLANTDADCCVPETWLLDQLAIAETNVQAIAGVISVDSFSEHGPEVAERFLASYLIYPDGTHPHVHGANLGVRADAYVQAGGWSSLSTAEDHDLWNRLQKTGTLRASLGSVKVVTSGRRMGRAPLGFAQALSAHNSESFEPTT